jgi:uncharacterized protein involved in type VI secretion and phage assembly
MCITIRSRLVGRQARRGQFHKKNLAKRTAAARSKARAGFAAALGSASRARKAHKEGERGEGERAPACPIRVAQCWSGKQWGEQHIPRVGMEVVVEFCEGDPDRPLVTGCVYNGDNKYPYDLPSNKTQSGWKSDSSKGHGGYNELMFEDKKGYAEVRFHAQKDNARTTALASADSAKRQAEGHAH